MPLPFIVELSTISPQKKWNSKKKQQPTLLAESYGVGA